MPVIPEHLRPGSMPVKAEIVFTMDDGSTRTYESETLASVTVPGYKTHYVDPYTYEPMHQSQEFSIEGYWWTCTDREATMRKKKGRELEKGDLVHGYGKVVAVGSPVWVHGRATIGVAFEDRPPHVFMASDDVYLTPSAEVEDAHYPQRTLRIEKSDYNGDSSTDELYLLIKDDGNRAAIWVRKDELLDAVNNPADPQ